MKYALHCIVQCGAGGMSDQCGRAVPSGDAVAVVMLCVGILAVLAGVGAVDMTSLAEATAVLFTS
ncbi:hypothetical protein AA12717_1287 [Gluconacetobacter sacchari DSM 12717]|nr:hypothetical protein AA12717_1287 [Gluconacetobacter sacchari DSM 12717]